MVAIINVRLACCEENRREKYRIRALVSQLLVKAQHENMGVLEN